MDQDEYKPLIRLGEVVKKLLPFQRPEKLSPPKESILPPLEGMRFLIAKSKTSNSVSLVWVDHDSNCETVHEKQDDGSLRLTDWHSYNAWAEVSKNWYRYVLRCPKSLTEPQRGRLETNKPPGHASRRLEIERDEANNRKKTRRQASAEDYD